MTAPERPALGYPNRVDGLDVSAVQGTIDYEKVASSGFTCWSGKIRMSESLRTFDIF